LELQSSPGEAAIHGRCPEIKGYFGHRIGWHFARDFERLEIVILPEFDNSHVGYGFTEVGAQHRRDGTVIPFALISMSLRSASEGTEDATRQGAVRFSTSSNSNPPD
jgi:hypothetical protein